MLMFIRTELSYAARPAPLAVLAKPALPLLGNERLKGFWSHFLSGTLTITLTL